MPENELRPLVVFDVDSCIADTSNQPPIARPGIDELFQVVAALGCEIRLWSGGGADHARNVAVALRLDGYVADYHNKPEYPPTREEAFAILGREPLLQVDDDGTERIPRLPGFVAFDSWWAVRADIVEEEAAPTEGPPPGFRWCPSCNGDGEVTTMSADPTLTETTNACTFPGCREGQGVVPVEA